MKRIVPSNVMITLYKAYMLLHFEYCTLLLLGISRTLNNRLEKATYDASRAILNLLRSRYLRFMSFSIASMGTLEKRRVEKSLIVLLQSFMMQNPSYTSNFFRPRFTSYYLRGSGITVLKPSYNKIITIIVIIKIIAFFFHCLLIDPINRSEIGCSS